MQEKLHVYTCVIVSVSTPLLFTKDKKT